MEPVSLLVSLLVLVVVVWLVFYVLGQMSIAEPVRTIIVAVVGLLILVVALRYLGLF